MIERIIAASVRHRGLVFLVTALAAVLGLASLRATPIDALPDLSDVQVIVIADVPGQSPQVVEDQVNYPLSSALLAVPRATAVRGTSFFGLAMVQVVFEDGTDLYWARSRVLEAIDVAQAKLPLGVTPRLGPDATGVGWIYQYVLTDCTPQAEALRKRLDKDQDGTVTMTELPPGAMSDAVIRDLLTDDVEEGLACLKAGFNRDGRAGLSRLELTRAANFRGVGLDDLRSLQDWLLGVELTAVPGVAEVASVGGFVRQLQVEVDPERLRAFDVTLREVIQAIQDANVDVGGRVIEMGETEFMVRARGTLTSLEDLETVPVGVSDESHAPILLGQLARIGYGPAPRRGLVDLDGKGDVVSGIVVMRTGENAREVIDRVEQRLEELAPSLPQGVHIVTAYDRSQLIDRAVATLNNKLLDEMLIVALVCGGFLLHARSLFVALISVPIGLLLSFVPMVLLDLSANIMSLGGLAIAVGVMVDASIVMVENLHKRRERHPHEDHMTAVLRATREVGPALFFSLLVVTVSFLPIFALEQEEGRLFTPLAWTKTFAMGFSAVLAITVVPALLVDLGRGRIQPESAHPVSRVLSSAYRPLLSLALRFPGRTLALAVALALLTLLPLSRLGSEFMPPLDEGDLLYMPTTPPGLSVTAARDLLQETDRLILSHPQVARVVGKAGRAETATDPAPLSMFETLVLLTPRDEWPAGKRLADVIDELDARVQVPGLTNGWTMPIRARLDMLATGVKTPIGVRLLGDNLEELAEVGKRVEAVLRSVPGTAAVFAERTVGGRYVDVSVRREDAARYGLNVKDIHNVIASAVGGADVTSTLEGLERYAVNVRYPRALRSDLSALREVAVPSPLGHTVPLGQVADITVVSGPPVVKSEDARRVSWVYVEPDTRDLGGYLARARAAVEREVRLPEGVSVTWAGQYASLQRASGRLAWVVPLTMGLIVVLLTLHFGRLSEAGLVVVATVLFAPLGGIWLLYASGYHLSVAVAVGFVALAGLAAETSVVMLVYLDEALARRQPRTETALRAAVIEGAVERLRPKLMTVLTTILGLLPILLGTTTGASVMKRIATPMVGGLLSSTLLTLVVMPALYLLWKRRTLPSP